MHAGTGGHAAPHQPIYPPPPPPTRLRQCQALLARSRLIELFFRALLFWSRHSCSVTERTTPAPVITVVVGRGETEDPPPPPPRSPLSLHPWGWLSLNSSASSDSPPGLSLYSSPPPSWSVFHPSLCLFSLLNLNLSSSLGSPLVWPDSPPPFFSLPQLFFFLMTCFSVPICTLPLFVFLCSSSLSSIFFHKGRSDAPSQAGVPPPSFPSGFYASRRLGLN